jgi:hypothetical protein
MNAMNNKEEVLTLIEKYWNAETSLHEEKMISDYIRKYPHDTDFQGIASLFQYFGEEAKITYESAAPLSLVSKTEKETSMADFFRKNILSIAAVICLAVVSVFLLKQVTEPDYDNSAYANHVVIEDPEEAFETVMAALQTVAVKLNKGEEKAKSSIESFKQINIFKSNHSF